MHREIRLFDAIDSFANGRVVTHALGLSFGYDGDLAYERVWRPVIERFGVRKPLVIADGAVIGRDAHEPGGGRVSSGTPLGVTVLRAARRGGVFHPKLFLAVREDAIFVAVGSANLTRGGLGGNLELLSALVFARDGSTAPRSVLVEVLEFLQAHVRSAIAGHVSAASLATYDQILEVAGVVADDVPEADRRDATGLAFVHTSGEALWNRVLAMHGDDPVQRIVVLSPLYEGEDPDDDDPDGLVARVLADAPWAPRAPMPRLLLHVGSLQAAQSIGGLPRASLARADGAVQLLVQNFSQETRRLHAKLVAIFGRRRTTLVWGSPNFTPSAFLRSADQTGRGNVECALVLRVRADEFTQSTLAAELELKPLFRVHEGPLPDPPSHAGIAAPKFEVGEVLYDPLTRLLELHAEVFDPEVRRLDVVDPSTGEVLFSTEAAREVHASWPASHLEEQESDLRKLRVAELVVQAVASDDSVLDRLRLRVNVRFEDALEVRQNYLLGPGVLSADALLVPTTAPPERRVAAVDAGIQRRRDAAREGYAIASRHQASLDVFYRNVRRGLTAHWRNLQSYRGSRFALLRWSTDLRRALAAASDASLDETRRAYLVHRTSEHVTRVVESISVWHEEPRTVVGVLGAGALAEALSAVPIASSGPAGIAAEVVAARDLAIARLQELR